MKQYRLISKSIILLMLVAAIFGSGCAAAAPAPPPAPSAPANQAPVILYIAAPQQVAPSSVSELKCIATDPDKDILTYTWIVEGGTITGSGDTVTWTAPNQAGTYKVVVKVSDGKGGEATNSNTSITITAKPNRSPVVNSFTVTPEKAPPVTFTMGMKSINLKRHSTASIECNAEDPDGDAITYTWSATAGRLIGDGKKVDYYAAEAGDHAITVTVTDSKGAFSKSSVYFNVPCCGQG